jgi:beta-glucosidase
MKLADAGAGFRINPIGPGTPWGTSTSWPSGLAMAASWDDDMVYRVAEAIGREFKAKDANVILGPAVQVHRVGINGRNFEYLSGEDPYLGTRLAAAYVEAVQLQGVIACTKHWAFNEQETNRMTMSVEVDEKTAWELYYPPFESTVKAGVGSFMCGYNKVNGTWDCENEKLLKTDLKGKMGFRGFVVSDWFATHGASWDKGLDQCMPGSEAWFAHETLECTETGIGCDELEQRFAPKSHGAEMLHKGMETMREYFGLPNPKNQTDQPGTSRKPEARDAVRRILAALYKLRVDASPGCDPGPGCMEPLKRDVSSFAHRQLAKEAAI